MMLLHRTKLLKTKQSGHNTAAAVDQVEMAKHSFLGKLRRRHQQHTTEYGGPAKFGATVFMKQILQPR
jgi:ribosomal protein L44E